MANRQIGWSQESNLLWQIGTQIDRLEKVVFSTLGLFVPTSRTLTINGTTYDLSADRSWTIAAGITGSGATGQVAYWNGTNSQTGSNNLFWDAANGRLGIGTNASLLYPVTIYNATNAFLNFNINSGSSKFGGFRFQVDGFDRFTIAYRGQEGNLVYSRFNSSGAYQGDNLTIFNATGNIVLTGSGSATDSGQRFQVQGTSYFSDSVGIGTTFLTGYGLRVTKNIVGAVDAFGVTSEGIIQSSVTATTAYFLSNAQTAASSFTLNNLRHFHAFQGTFGLGSNVVNQIGYLVESNLIGAANNFGFYGNIPAGTNRWNIYMGGTANNYLRGKLLINTTTVGTFDLDVNGTARVSGNSLFNGYVQVYNATLPYLDIRATTTAGRAIINLSDAGQSSFMIYNYYGSTSGAGGVFNNSFVTMLAGGNYYFQTSYGTPTSSGVAYSIFLSKSISINSVTEYASAQLAIDSTTKGFLPPRMTTTQKNAIGTPAAGLMVFDTTLAKLCVYSGSAWETITSI